MLLINVVWMKQQTVNNIMQFTGLVGKAYTEGKINGIV